MRKYAVLTCFIAVLCAIVPCRGEGISSIQWKKLGQTLQNISDRYVDTVDSELLIEAAINGILKDLDPHSTYYSAKEAAKLNAQIDGNFEGIGVQFMMLEDTLVVTQTIAGCPADRVGVLPGDKIIMADGKPISGVKMSSSDIMTILRGKAGSTVKIMVKRTGAKHLIEFVIQRGKIPIYSVDAAYMITPAIGYVKLNNFSATTPAEFSQALNDLRAQGMKQLLIDLQGNGGGLLHSATSIIDEFLSYDQTIVQTKGRKYPTQTLKATDNGTCDYINLVVLVDENSASASEIMAGALQDWDRAVIVGRRTFGKGLVQLPFPLIDGSLMRLTVARYYTPSGRNIQKPYDKGNDTYRKELEERFKHGELTSADSINFPDSLQYKTKILGRTVYGGGGIMPDVFVPLDTTRTTNYHRDLLAKGVMSKTVVEYLTANRKRLLKTFATFEQFDSTFHTDTLLNTLIDNGTKNGIEFDQTAFDAARSFIMLQLKALLARDLYGNSYYYRVMNSANDIVQRGIEVLENYNEYLK
ncbi:MAG: S41 family peptidase [Paludibacteraceae bacterium]